MNTTWNLHNIAKRPGPSQKKAHIAVSLLDTGADERNRTSDLLITNQLLYRLSYLGTGRAL